MESENNGEFSKSQIIRDFSISYDDVGKGEIPIIFIHGFPFDKSSWQNQLDFFRKSHRVIAYDIRGFGKSTSETEGFCMALFAEDLIKFMDSLNIPKAIVCGLSMGGYILLNAISRFPTRFSAIILSDTQCISDSEEGREKRLKAIEQIRKNGIDDFADGFIDAVFCENSKETKKGIVENIRKVIKATSVSTVTQTLMALAERLETCSILNRINVPVLVICGAEDKVTPLEQSQYIVDHIIGSKLIIIEDAGHLSNIENPIEFNKHVADFILAL